MNGDFARQLRDRLKMKQQQVASEVMHCAQRTVSDLETKPGKLDEKDVERVSLLIEYALKHGVSRAEIDRMLEERFAFESQRYSWPEKAMRTRDRQELKVWEALELVVPHRAASIEAKATITWSRGNDKFAEEFAAKTGKPVVQFPDNVVEKFADVVMDLTFIKLATNDSYESLVMDALGNPNGPDGQPAPVHVELLKVENTSHGGLGIDFEAFGDVRDSQLGMGEHAVSYRIRGADANLVPRFTVRLTSRFCFVLDQVDCIGFPVYADLLADAIRVEAKFVNLRPDPSPPTCRPHLIRRYTRAARPLLLTDTEFASARKHPEEPETYIFGPLKRPRPGYGYLISWKKLKPLMNGGGNNHA